MDLYREYERVRKEYFKISQQKVREIIRDEKERVRRKKTFREKNEFKIFQQIKELPLFAQEKFEEYRIFLNSDSEQVSWMSYLGDGSCGLCGEKIIGRGVARGSFCSTEHWNLWSKTRMNLEDLQ